MHKTPVCVVALLVTSLHLWAADAPPPSVAARCEAYMQARLKVSKFNGTVLVAKDGQPLFAKGYGFANFEHDVPNTPQTKFRLASVSKQFAAVGIMILEADGKLKVEDSLKKHLPDCPKAWGEVTVHQLLSHTSGVPENLRPALFKGIWPMPVELDHLLDVVKDKPLDFKPGEKWSYSNTGYALLGLIIEKLSGKPYGEFLKERIFDPLGMLDTGVDHRRLVLKNRASGYGLAKGDVVPGQYIDLSQVYAAGSLYSTVEDLLKWDSALYTEKILSKKSLERMWTPVKDGYGYGWISRTRLGRKTILHDGSLPGFKTLLVRYPEQKVLVVVLCNLDGSALIPVSNDLAAIALGDPYDLPVERKEVKVSPRVYDAVVGDYAFGLARTITISKTNDNLYAQIAGQIKFQVFPESETKYFAKLVELTITFQPNEQGKVNQLVLRENARDITAKRVVKPPEKKDEKKDDKKDDKKEDKKEPKKAG